VNADRTPQRDYWEVKAVYAPVRLPAGRIAFNASQPVLRIPVRNDHDFLDLNTVKIAWTLYRDADAILDAPPRVTANLEIPTSKIGNTARHVYYVDIVFIRADGSEMTRKSVRIGCDSTPQPPAPAGARPAAPKVEKQPASGIVAVTVAGARYEFNSATGEIASIDMAGKRLTDGATLVVWRPVDYGERNPLDKRERQYDWDTFMQNVAPKLLKWDIAEAADAVRITARVEYRADDCNTAIANYTYTITNTGILRVMLEVEPDLDVPFIPETGLEFSIGKKLTRLTWLGCGPLNSVAGKTAATRFGWWSYAPADALAQGNKWIPEWTRLTVADGAGLHVRGAQATRLGGDTESGYTLRVLTHQSGGWTKLFPPENPAWYLNLEKGKTFKGSFDLVPVAK
jgi:beta-galactosidase